MSFYTGRYVFTHGGTWNNIPIRVDEHTMGDFLRPLGYRVGLVGKTHFQRDLEGMKKLGISPESDLGVLISESGFEPWEEMMVCIQTKCLARLSLQYVFT